MTNKDVIKSCISSLIELTKEAECLAKDAEAALEANELNQAIGALLCGYEAKVSGALNLFNTAILLHRN